MSTQDHPNLHAVQLATDILDAISRALRGRGTEVAHDLMGAPIRSLVVRLVGDAEMHVDYLVRKRKGPTP